MRRTEGCLSNIHRFITRLSYSGPVKIYRFSKTHTHNTMHTHNIFALLPPIVSINPIVIQQSGRYDFRGTKLVTLLSKSFGNDPGSERSLSLRWRSSTTDHPQISPFHRHLRSSFRARRLIKQRRIDSLVIKISRFFFFENWCNSLWIAEMSM